MHRIKLKYIGFGVLLVIVLLACFAWLFYWWNEKQRLSEELSTSIPHVSVETVSFGYLRPITRAKMTVRPKTKLDAISYLNAQVLETYVHNGQKVTKGQLLALLDTDELDREVSKAKEKVSSAEAELDNVTIELGRSEILAKATAISQKILGDVKTKQLQAKNNLNIARLDLENLVSKINKKYVESPMDGTVLKIFSYVGMPVKQGSVVASIANTVELEGKAIAGYEFDDTMGIGDEVEIIFENIRDKVFFGKIVNLKDNKQEGKARSLELDIPFLDNNGDITSYYATMYNVIIREKNDNCVLTVPRRALLFEERQVFVYVLRSDSTVVRRRVEVAGIAGNDYSYLKVNEGLTEGEYVVVTNLDKLSSYYEKVIVD